MQTPHHMQRMADNPSTRLLAAIRESRTYPEADRALFFELLLAELVDDRVTPAHVWHAAMASTRRAMAAVDLAGFDAALERGTL